MRQTCIIKCFAVVFLFESATSLKDVTLDGLSLETVSSLLEILGKYKNDVQYVIVSPNNRKRKQGHRNNRQRNYFPLYEGFQGNNLAENKRFQRPGKHVFIKRILPHGLPPAKLEYDHKYKTYYRPLVRVHKTKALPKIKTILNIDGNANGIDKYGIDVYDYFDNDEDVVKFAINEESRDNSDLFKVDGENSDPDEELLQPFVVNNFAVNYENPDERSTQLTLLKEIQKLLRKIRSKSSRKETYHDITTALLDKIATLRSNQEPGGEPDLLATGHLVNVQNAETDQPPAHKEWFSRYPPWNYWTYSKTIYHDECPEAQVKIANLCMWIPPH